MSAAQKKPKGAKKQKKGKQKVQLYYRKRGRKTSAPNEALLNLLKPSEQDVMKLLAAQTHIGRRRAHTNMKRYIWKRRDDGIHVINLEKTWEKLILAARILVTVKDPSDICVMSTRTYGQRGAIKFAHYTGATPMVGKWVPGTFTNPQNKAFFEPRLLIVDDPSTCFAALRETSYVGIPVIALCGTDNNTRFVDCCIPCNNRGKFSVGLMFWLLARELLRMRGDDPNCIRSIEWKESVDLFFYRDADEIKRQQDAKLAKQRARQQMEQQDYGQPQDSFADVPAQDEYAEPEQGYAPEMGGDAGNWDMPDDTAIEDWGQQNYEEAAPQQYADDQQVMYQQEAPLQPEQQQPEQQPPQQQQPAYEEQQYEQGAYDQQPPYDDQNQGAMQMSRW